MTNPSPREMTGDQWAHKNPHWMLLARVAFWGMLAFFVFGAFFSEPYDGLTAEEYAELHGPDNSRSGGCYHPLDC